MEADPLISQNAYVVTTGTFFAVAIVVATARIAIRVYKFGRLSADDYLLFLALAALICSNALFFLAVPELYLFVNVSTGRAVVQKNIIQTATDTAIYAYTAEILSWTTIFAVKFSFLFYFRALVERLRGLTIWWRVVFVICIPIAVTSVCGTFMVCPYVGSEIISHCVAAPDFLRRERIVLYYGVVMDIVTDALIISIPICLLRKTHLKLRQKISLGILLCLSIFMIAIAMVRGISARVHGSHDQIWASFWVQLETSISVIMVSTMIFKSLFIVKKGSSPQKYSPRYSNRVWRRKKTPQLPEIETGATMTGMRTVIRENGRTVMGSFGKDTTSLDDGSTYGMSSKDSSTLVDGHQVV